MGLTVVASGRQQTSRSRQDLSVGLLCGVSACIVLVSAPCSPRMHLGCPNVRAKRVDGRMLSIRQMFLVPSSIVLGTLYSFCLEGGLRVSASVCSHSPRGGKWLLSDGWS